MKIIIRGESVVIEGYVNAIERSSRPLMSRIGEFIERICKGAFKNALKRNDNVRILLNHDWNRVLGGTGDGNLQLEEDAIGLHAKAIVTDAEVVAKARAGDIIGWSFGFTDRDVENTIENGKTLRLVRDLNLHEVSLIDRRMRPAYEGTLVSVRANENGEEQVQFRADPLYDEVEITEEKEERAEGEPKNEPVDNPVEKPVENLQKMEEISYNKYENIINGMKGVK